MNISCLTREQREFFMDMDPFQMMDWLEFPGSFALVATERNEMTGEDIPAGLMICSVNRKSLIIDWLCVSVRYRMQGVGEQLLLKAFELAKNATLGTVGAYINEEYGRELVCHGQEQYFKERLFGQERSLFGEWVVDLRTLARHPLFAHDFVHERESMTGVVSFRKLPAAMIRDGMASLVSRTETAMLYDMSGVCDCYEPDLSFFLMDGGRVCAGLVVQCTGRDMLPGFTATLYPTLFCVGSEQEAHMLLVTAMRAACEKYDPRTDIRVIPTDARYGRLCAYLMPDRRSTNTLLIADVSDFDTQMQSLPDS